MNRMSIRITCGVAAIVLLIVSGLVVWHCQAGDKGDRPFGLSGRTPWTTSHITGSPEPPLPYRIERAFPKLTFTNPLLLVTAPGSDRWFVGEQAGQLFSFRKDQNVGRADLF